MIRELFPLRTCNLNLSPENIAKGKYKICLEYQIGNCKGPCEGYQSEEDYNQNLADIKDKLNGKIVVVTNRLKKQMNDVVIHLYFKALNKVLTNLARLSNY